MTTNRSKTDAPAEAVSQIKPMRVQVAPHSQAAAIAYARLGLPGSGVGKRPMNVAVAPRSSAGEAGHAGAQPAGAAPIAEAIAPGLHPTPAHDLVFQGGKTLRNLVFTNLYVGGQASWNATDVQSIDDALSAAMSDQRLNNVMMQYFNNQSITSTFRPSQILPGAKPAVVSQGDVEAMVSDLYTRGLLDAFDLGSTVFNFMLPSGTILNTDAARTAQAANVHHTADAAAGAGAGAGAGAAPQAVVPDAEQEADSLNGLGGYHGSIHTSKQQGAQVTLYYAVGVFSEVLANGRANGIPVFNKPWKNVVATFYHELNEARTDVDVEDAIRAGNDPAGTRFLGWVSQDGEECGDFPISEANPLTQVMKEVRLTNSTKKVPVQFQYSNAVHGPEGPIAHPH